MITPIQNKKEYYISSKLDNIIGDKLQPFQKFIRNYMNEGKNLIVIASTGSGKTIVGVMIAENRRKFYQSIPLIGGRIYIIGPREALNNFINTLIDLDLPLTNLTNNIDPKENNPYMSNEERNQYKNIEKDLRNHETPEKKREYSAFRQLIRKRLFAAGYSLFTNQKFINVNLQNIDNSLIIVDEIHRLANDNEFNKNYMALMERSKNVLQVGLTATIMMNNPRDVINVFNLQRVTSKKIIMGRVFRGDLNEGITIVDGGIDYLQELVAENVIYIKGQNPKFYPKRIDVGEIPAESTTITNIRYKINKTKVMRFAMSQYQYSVYKANWTGVMDRTTTRNILNMVIPDENDKPIFNNLELIIANSDTKYLKRMGIEFYRRGPEIFVTGKFLHYPEIKKYSPKYAFVISQLNKIAGTYEDGHIFIFNTFVNNYGTKLVAEMLRQNGWHEYGQQMPINDSSIHYQSGITFAEWSVKNKNSNEFIPATFASFYKELTENQRTRLINTFKSPENKDYHIIKAIIGSDVTRESIDFKRIRHIFIMNYQENFPRVEQIVGRGIRHKSHSDLAEWQKSCYVYLMVSAIPKKDRTETVGLSAEEIEVAKDEKNYIIMKKIERALKIASVNCPFHRNYNIYRGYGKTGSVECDYTTCNYECKNNIELIMPTKINLSYKLFYKDYEIFDAIQYIRSVFKKNLFMAIETLIELIENDLYIYRDFIILAIDKCVAEKIQMVNQNNIDGYIFRDGGMLYFQPIAIISTAIDLNVRLHGSYGSQLEIQIDENLANLQELQDESSIDVEVLLADIAKKPEQIALMLSKLTLVEKIVIVEYAIRSYHKAYMADQPIEPIVFEILKTFKRYLLDDLQFTADFNNNNFDNYFSSLLFNKIDKTKLFVGHFLKQPARLYNEKRDKFEDIDETNTYYIKRKSKRKLVENSYIVGYLERDSNDEIVFKLRFTQEEVADKRKEFRGFSCHQSNSKELLIKILKKLNVKIPSNIGIMKIKNICEIIEQALRLLQEKNNKAGKNIRWFYDYDGFI